MNTSDHILQFFSSDESYVRAVGRYLHEGLAAGDTCVAVATAEHLRMLDEYLAAAGLDVGALSAEYRYIPLHTESTLATFFDAHSGINRPRFHRQFNQLMSQASASGRPVRVFGEMVSLLVARGRPTAAILLEELWNELSREHNFSLFCVYEESEFTRDPQNRKLLHGIHSHVLAEGA
ncbi:MEDS domain-containing protein [Steroidobacter sp.]|uniref:MEDS domain-containing protein n=1 Tax=Steroidobacter sp. TaxID=1978227 RepID=UPI001A4F307F|nr:MEDS domain-containing protein [Steroidobacter sp.]MBL8271779.1 MEDS domain-containing protein [Steroidobacter sp.]